MNQKGVRVCCITPVFNDWASFAVLRSHIAALEEGDSGVVYEIVAVDDGSIEQPTPLESVSLEGVTLVRLKVNVGHQRAIAVGLQYVYNEMTPFDYYVVLDSDGEDRPEHLPLLLAEAQKREGAIVFAERNRRQESIVFKVGYFFYKSLFSMATGQHISFGNFSIIPRSRLKTVVYQNQLWNHYSGAIIQSRIPFAKLLLDRGSRYKGTSKMNFNSLVLHGLSSISVYFDVLSVRILRLALLGITVGGLGIAYILYQKTFTDNAIPGWASSLTLVVVGIMVQLTTMTLLVLLMQLSSRKNITPPNALLYKDFIE